MIKQPIKSSAIQPTTETDLIALAQCDPNQQKKKESSSDKIVDKEFNNSASMDDNIDDKNSINSTNSSK